jgi:hypothetical protein
MNCNVAQVDHCRCCCCEHCCHVHIHTVSDHNQHKVASSMVTTIAVLSGLVYYSYTYRKWYNFLSKMTHEPLKPATASPDRDIAYGDNNV